MQKRIFTVLMIILGISLGISFLPMAWKALNLSSQNYFINALIGAVVFFILAMVSARSIFNLVRKIESFLSRQSLSFLLFGSVGTIVGLIVGVLFSVPFFNSDYAVLSNWIPTIIMVGLGYLGFRVGTTRMDEFRKIFSARERNPQALVLDRRADETFREYKILDTSVIIDGRVYDIARTGFIEGTLLIPNFVLYELQTIADSADSLKRVRGRRGLDILNALQKEEGISVEMYEGDFEDISEVDSKLIKLAKLLDGIVVTNDFNLNKVCEFQNVPVLNINELANAVKPVVIPGEKMHVLVVKEGTERQQGVAYLDDGTMVVVEDGQHFMNQDLDVVVTSALQTAAGRMIFAKPVHAQRGLEEKKKNKKK